MWIILLLKKIRMSTSTCACFALWRLLIQEGISLYHYLCKALVLQCTWSSMLPIRPFIEWVSGIHISILTLITSSPETITSKYYYIFSSFVIVEYSGCHVAKGNLIATTPQYWMNHVAWSSRYRLNVITYYWIKTKLLILGWVIEFCSGWETK